jgi:hypothetical protein
MKSSKNIEGLAPNPSPGGEGNGEDFAVSEKFFQTADKKELGNLKRSVTRKQEK